MTRQIRSIAALATLVAMACIVWTANADVEREKTAGSLDDYARSADLVPMPEPSKDPIWTIGRTLFGDPRLSASRTVSCASCHDPANSWTDQRAKAVGEHNQTLKFRVPTLLNAAQIDRYGWTGRFNDITEVSFFAMSSPSNMNLGLVELLARLSSDPAYISAFEAAFPDHAISKTNVGSALTRFVRSIASSPAPFDRWVEGDRDAISPEAARGFSLFRGKAGCADCHSGWALTDGSFHDIGIATGTDIGRGQRFKTSVKLQYAFKTPTLRSVAVRAPYMHDGSLTTLRAVIDHYDHGGISRPSRAEGIRPLHLDETEKQALVSFLETLTSPSEYIARRD